MKVIYMTSYTFPSKRAEPYYLKSMAEAFVKILGNNFHFVIRGTVSDELKHTNAVSMWAPKRVRTFYYLVSFPFYAIFQGYNNKEVVFISNDPYLLCIFIFWKKLLRFKYRVCADWHQLFDDWKDVFIIRNSDYVISTSQRLKSITTTVCDIDPSKILVAYGGINVDLFSEKLSISKKAHREKLGLPVDKFLVGYMGGFRSVGLEKGIDLMIKSLQFLNEDTLMVFVGGTKEYIDEYTLLAKGLNVEERCLFVEKQPFHTLIEYELAMDTLVIPYPNKHHFSDYGFPMKVWEYMATGRPIVYSNLEIIAEILKDRGVPFVPDNEHSLADAVVSIARGSEERAEGNTRDVLEYTWDMRVSKIVHFMKTHVL